MSVDVAKLRELMAKATPKPWAWSFEGDKCNGAIVGTVEPPFAGKLPDGDTAHIGDEQIADVLEAHNAAFIVAAINALPDLLEAYEREQNAKKNGPAAIRLGDTVTSAVPGEGVITAEDDGRGTVRVAWSDGALYDVPTSSVMVVKR